MHKFKSLFNLFKDNAADAYILFICLIIGILIMVTGLFTIIKTNITINKLHNEIETMTDVVSAEIKKENYNDYIEGISTYISVDMTLNDFITRFATSLNASTDSNENIVKMQENNNIAYTLSNITFTCDNDILSISFNIEIPIRFNGIELYTDTKYFTMHSTLKGM